MSQCLKVTVILGTSVLSGCTSESGVGPGFSPSETCSVRPLWMSVEPLVLDPSSSEPVTLRLVYEDCVPPLLVLPSGGRNPIPFDSAVGDTAFLTLPTSAFLWDHDSSDPHSLLGIIEVPGGFANVFVNVRTSDMPNVPVTQLEAGAQRSRHVLNLQVDSPISGGYTRPLAELANRAMELLPGSFDFVALVNSVTVFQVPWFLWIRSQTRGIGREPFDQLPAWTAGGLQVEALDRSGVEGILIFPHGSGFDAGGPALLHQLAHRWMNHLVNEPFLNAGPHWPPYSDLADGIMTYNLPNGGNAHTRWRLRDLGYGLGVDCAWPAPKSFRPLELYLMGLLPPDSVPPVRVWENQSHTCDAVWPHDESTLVTVEEVVATNGERLPAWPDAPRSFRLATVVVSIGRLLSPHEMAFFDYMAARGEANQTLRASLGYWSGLSNPFLVATKARGQLVTNLGAP